MTSPFHSGQWLTRKQVAARTGYSEKTLANWSYLTPAKGPRSFRGPGGKVRYLSADVDRWMADMEQQAAA